MKLATFLRLALPLACVALWLGSAAWAPAAAATDPGWQHLRFDAEGRLQSVALPAGGSVQVVNDRAGRPRFWMDANGAAASPQRIGYRRYDTQGRPVEEGDVECRFDAALLQRLADMPTEPSGAQRQWRRRFFHGPETVGGQPGSQPLLAVHTRDAAGLLHVQAFRHDAMGRVTAVTESLGDDSPAMETRYRYDEHGRVAQVAGPAPLTALDQADAVLYRYDAQDRIVSIGRRRHGVDEPEHYATYTWNAAGELVAEVRNPGAADGRVMLRYGLDTQGRLTSVQATVDGDLRYAQTLRYDGRLITGMQQRYAQAGRTLQRRQWRRGAAEQADAALQATIDPRSERLLQVQGVDGSAHAYAYDRNGNVLRKTGQLERIDVDPFLNRAQALYTSNGVKQRLRYGGVELERVWGAVSSGPPGARRTVQQGYYRGLAEYPLLIRREVRDDAKAAAADGATVSSQRLVWGPGGLVAVTESGEASGVSEAGKADAIERFVVGNHQASTVLVLDAHGRTQARYAYGADGTVLDGQGAPLRGEPLVPYLFQGQEYDWATGLHNYRARLYDSATRRFLAPDPVVQPGEPVYLAMKGDAVNWLDPDGRMIIGNWRAAIRRRGQNVMATTFGWGATFGMGSIFLMGLHYAPAGALAANPFVLAAGIPVMAYYTYFALKSWRNDPAARRTAGILTGLVTGIFQATHGPIGLKRRAQLLVTADVPAAFLMVVAAQGGPEFATLWTGAAEYNACLRFAVYMCAYATNSFSEVVGNGLAVYLQDATGQIQLAPNTTYLEKALWNSANMLSGNGCFYFCMAVYDAAGRWEDHDFKTVQCKNFWTGCRFATRLASGIDQSARNGTAAGADGLLNAAFGVLVDRAIGQQILNNLPLYAVHGLFFTGIDPLEEEWQGALQGALEQQLIRMGSGLSPTSADTERFGLTPEQADALMNRWNARPLAPPEVRGFN